MFSLAKLLSVQPAPAGGTAHKSTNHTAAITDQRGLLISLTAAPQLTHLHSVPSTRQNSLSGLVFANYKYIYLYYTPMHTKILSISQDICIKNIFIIIVIVAVVAIKRVEIGCQNIVFQCHPRYHRLRCLHSTERSRRRFRPLWSVTDVRQNTHSTWNSSMCPWSGN